jgi:hypothetical protein
MQEIESIVDEVDVVLAAWVWAKLGNPAASTPQRSPSM